MLHHKSSTRSHTAKPLPKHPTKHRILSHHLRSTSTSSVSSTLHETPNTVSSTKPKKWAISWGCSLNNGLGFETQEPYECHPRRVPLPRLTGQFYTPYNSATAEISLAKLESEDAYADVATVKSGWTTTLAITDEGRVFQWGFRGTTRSMVKRKRADDHFSPRFNSWFERTVGVHPWAKGSPKPIRIPVFGCENQSQMMMEVASADLQNFPNWMTPERMRAVKADANADNRGVLTTGGHLFTWSEVGDGYGSLGHGSKYKAANKPTMIPIPDIVDFAFGYNHLIFVTANGQVYSCGNTDGGATGLPLAYLNLKQKNRRVFKPLNVNQNYHAFLEDLHEAYKSIDTNTDSSYKSITNTSTNETIEKSSDLSVKRIQYKMGPQFRTDKIDLSQWDNPQTTSKHVNDPKITLDPRKILQADLDHHQQMRIYGDQLLVNIAKQVNWKGVEGREGAVDTINLYAKNRLPNTFPKMKKVAAGFAHSLILDEHGAVWSCGRNAHGELGHIMDPENEEDINDLQTHLGANSGLTPVDFRTYYFPTKIRALEEMGLSIAKIAAGLHHSAVLTKQGDVYTFGSNEYGQCGRLSELPSTMRSKGTLGHKQPWSLPPGKLNISPRALNGARIVDVVCGYYDTSVVLSDGRCLVVGSYLTKENKAHALFSLLEFEPTQKTITSSHISSGINDETEYDSDEYTTESEGDSGDILDHTNVLFDPQPSRYLIQSLSSRNFVPKQHYLAVQQYEYALKQQGDQNDDITQSSAYFLKNLSFGWQHATGVAIPRSLLHTAVNSQNPNHITAQASQLEEPTINIPTTFEDDLKIDETLLGAFDAHQHHAGAINSDGLFDKDRDASDLDEDIAQCSYPDRDQPR